MERLLIAVAIVVVVGVVATVVRSRRSPDAPTQRRFSIPEQLDRADFVSPQAPWLVAVFTSATCDVCRSVVGKALVLASDDVAVEEVEYGADRTRHERYGIDAVPTTVVADAAGVVVAWFVGTVTATDLWAAVAEVRDPGSTPGNGACGREPTSP
jgi:hypothetical protein